MPTSCSDVCDVVIARLIQLNFPVDVDAESDDHDEILAALDQCRLARIPELPRLLEAGVIWQDGAGDYYTLSAVHRPEGEELELLMGEPGKEPELEEWLREHPIIDTWTHDNRWPEGEP